MKFILIELAPPLQDDERTVRLRASTNLIKRSYELELERVERRFEKRNSAKQTTLIRQHKKFQFGLKLFECETLL